MLLSTLKYFKYVGYQKVILWTYLVWYLSIMSIYFEPSLSLWASSVGISFIIGIALILSTNQEGRKHELWVKVRLFLFPFCVSSYSATIKDYDFIMLFPTNLFHLGISLLACVSFLVFVWITKRFYSLD